MSALGHKQTKRPAWTLSALPPKADIDRVHSRRQLLANAVIAASRLVAAQIVTVPMAMLVGAKADAWGRKPLFFIECSIRNIGASPTTISR
jgi:hypothetical protein